MEVLPEDEIMIITKQGVIIRSSVAQIRVTGRNAQGVKLVQLDDKDLVTAVARVVGDDKSPGGEDDVEGVGVPGGPDDLDEDEDTDDEE
jgi:DNA gyrase subunit A